MFEDPSTQKKRRAAEAAVRYIESGMVLGVGTGSTVNQLIEVLKERKIQLSGAVSSSRQTSEKIRAAGIEELDLNTSGDLNLYIDGADEATADGALIKGGGAALTREKVIAAASKRFVCIIDDSKLVPVLGRLPAPRRGHPDGPLLRRAPAGEARRPAGVARGGRHRQRQSDLGCP